MKYMIAYTAALALAVAVLFGAYKAEAHNDGAAIAGAAIGFGLGIAAGRHAHRDYFPTGPAFYPYNYYIPSPYFYGQPYFYGPPYIAPRPIYRPYRRLPRYRY